MRLRRLKHDWFLWVLAALLSLTVFAASGCSSGDGPKPLRAGEFVELKLTGERGQITLISRPYLSGGRVYYEVRLEAPANVVGAGTRLETFRKFELRRVE